MNNTNKQQDTADEDSGILVEEFLKFTDPESGEVIHEGRV
jgi:hypothetical protein